MSKLTERLQEIWVKFKIRNSQSKIANITNISAEEWKEDFEDNFNSAKKISDFIGFIVRWIFLQFVWSYCLSRSLKEDNFIISYALGMLFVAAAWLQMVFSLKIFSIIMAYYCKDIQLFQSKWPKVFMAIISMFQVIILYMGVSYFIREVARNTSLLK